MLFSLNSLFRVAEELIETIIFIFSFSTFPNLVWPVKKPEWCFSVFWILLLFFGFFDYRLGRNWTEWLFLFSLFLGLSPPVLAWREALIMFYSFMNFFAIFLEFSVSGRVGIDRNDNSYFLSFLVFPNLFWLEEKPYSCSIIFWIFLLFLF